MRVLYVCRAFMGLESTWRYGQWDPRGVPTIYKVIEALNICSREFQVMFTIRGETESVIDTRLPSYREINVAGLHSRILISSEPFRLPRFLRRLQTVLVEVVHIVRVMREVQKMQPDLVYVDRTNLIPGAFVARFTKVPVLLRIMGILPVMWEIIKSFHPWLLIMRWAYRSPFTQVLCTQDGTPGETFMNTVLSPEVPRTMMLNGVDKQQGSDTLDPKLINVPPNRFVVLFIGRLVDLKDPQTFVEAVLRLHPEYADRIHALIIGTGELEGQLRARVSEAGADNMFTFISSVPHRQMGSVHRLADVYISLNRMGNLSNANLECMYDGMCMIVPPARPEDGTDVDLGRLMPQDTIIRLTPSSDEVSQLASLIEQLSKNPSQVQERRQRTSTTARATLWSWEERIEAEMEILKTIVGIKCNDVPSASYSKSEMTPVSKNALE